MVVALSVVPHEIQNSCQCVADDSRSNVPNVQRFGDVGGRVVDDVVSGCFNFVHSKAVITKGGRKGRLKPLVVERQVDESGAGDFDVLTDLGQIGCRDDLFSHFTRRFTSGLA